MSASDYFAVQLSKFRTEFFANEKLDAVYKWVEDARGRSPKTFYVYQTTDRLHPKLIRVATFDPKLVWKDV